MPGKRRGNGEGTITQAKGGQRMPAATPGVLLLVGAICVGVVILAVIVIFVVFVPRTTRMGEGDGDQ